MVKQALWDYVAATAAVLGFYGRYVTSFDQIHPDVSRGRMLPPTQHIGTLRFDGALARRFERDYAELKEVTRRCARHSLSYPAIVSMCHAVRYLTCVAAFVAPRYALLVGALQFVVAPLSLPVAAMKLLTYAPEGVLHYALALTLGFGGGVVLGPVVTMDGRLLACLMAVDQVANLLVYLLWSEPFGLSRLIRHAVYGTLDTKLDWLVVFGCLYGSQLDIGLTLLVGLLTLGAVNTVLPEVKAWLRVPCQHVLFYVDHRLGHLPTVYTHAHKMHHTMHDTTPWSAHAYGEGMNEHYFLMLLDILPCMLAPSLFHVPYCFSLHLLYITWTDKPSHTRLKPGTPYEIYANFHSDHHVLHTKNMALIRGALLDFYFGSMGPTTHEAEGLSMSRREEDGEVVIEVAQAGVTKLIQTVTGYAVKLHMRSCL
ncbi:unnamed protein product [Symbiodinium natans]|uniref:Fatty acid hydroxylase domain-containing protein n=1 Tax=Symbiodinium natans TaxID=878477 RepID=A0A812M963_9DINO|nr:unnamed protein product [Symbiodinium natans]